MKGTRQLAHSAFLLLFFLTVQTVMAAGDESLRIEPPHWWSGMVHDTLQLMVYGTDMGSYTVSCADKDLKVIGMHQADSPNYLFVDLDVSQVSPGEYILSFARKGYPTINQGYRFKQRVKGSADRSGFDPSDVIYLITPDRFVNGSPENDNIASLSEGLNREAEYGRHGGDLKGIHDHLDYIKSMGFTSFWLNPVLENDQEKWSYHGYATTDYYAVDPRFGTHEQYVNLALDAKEMGLGMIMDIIVNHCGSGHWWMEDLPFSDWINHQEKGYTPTNHKKETLLDPYGSRADRLEMTRGWFVPAMPDLNQRNPFMSTYLIQNTIWWIEEAHLQGVRQDTYSYPFREFMTDWTCAIMKEYPRFSIVGEEWVEDPSIIAYWQQGKLNQDGYTSCLPSLMDFPLTFALHKALNEEEEWNKGLDRLYQHMSKDFHYADPSQLVIFPDNHDMSRVFTQIGEDFTDFKMAMCFVLTTRGVPQIYYGTEILMTNRGTESHGVIRSDFPGGWEGDTINAFTGQGLSSQAKEAQAYIRDMLQWRKSQEAIHSGRLLHYVPRDGVYCYFRILKDQAVMVMLNRNEEEGRVDLSRFDEALSAFSQMKMYDSDFYIALPTEINLTAPGPYIIELK